METETNTNTETTTEVKTSNTEVEKPSIDVEKIKADLTKELSKDFTTKLAEKDKLIKELSQYKPVEKSDAEKAMEDRLAKIEAREAEVKAKELSMNFASKLKENNIPSELAKFIKVGEEDVDTVVKDLKDVWNKLVLDNTFHPSTPKFVNKVSKEEFSKMDYTQRVKLMSEQPDLYKELCK